MFRSATEPFDTSTPVGRMLVQMLGVFAEFEREVIIDRVIAGMERKAAKGLWNGGARPLGYSVNRDTWKLVPSEPEASTVRLIFDLYTRDRLGTKAIANLLNDRGIRTRMGRPWSPHAVEVVITNRVYIGEKSFRDIVVMDAHPTLISAQQFDEAQAILGIRSVAIGKRAANPSDYTLTGRIRCPECGRGFVGTSANGRYQRYRYYTCWSRVRYGTKAGCGIYRFNADEVEAAVGQALLDLYTNRADLIDEALAMFASDHASGEASAKDQLAVVERELRDNRTAVDRYLTAFERGNLDDEDDEIKSRLTALRSQRKQLAGRKAELEMDLQRPTEHLSPADFAGLQAHISEVLTNGSANVKKALFEALVDEIKIEANDSLTPIFRIPALPAAEEGAESEDHRPGSGVRALTTMVEVLRRYSNNADLVDVMHDVLRRIEERDQTDEEGVRSAQPSGCVGKTS